MEDGILRCQILVGWSQTTLILVLLQGLFRCSQYVPRVVQQVPLAINVIIEISGHFFYNNRPHVGGVKIEPNFPPQSGSPGRILGFFDPENNFRVCGRLFSFLQ